MQIYGNLARVSDLLRPVDLKLKRAEQQIRQLLTEVSAWAAANPIQMRCHLLDDRLGYRLVQDEYSTAPPIDDWGLLAGECFHNLRSALDNLAFALARLHNDPPERPNAIAFPIYREKKAFEKSGRRNIDQLSPEVANHIERIQPFQRDGSAAEGTPDQDPLLKLQWFNNMDKHRVPSIVLLAPTEIGHGHEVEFRTEEEAAANAPPDVTASAEPLHPGAVLFEMRTKHPLASVKGTTQVRAIVAIETDQKPMAIESLLPPIVYYTSAIVNTFRQFFAQ